MLLCLKHGVKLTVRLSKKVILVTGSSSGIGEGIARKCAAEGASVMVHGKGEVESTAISQSILQIGGESSPVFGDLSDPAVPARLVAETIECYGRLDGLVNCAGISTRASLESVSPEIFDHLMAVNARAPMLAIQAAWPHFKAQGRGAVLNIGSVCAYRGPAHLVPYSMTKAALANLTITLAGAFAKDGLRINQLNVGWTLTDNEYQLGLEDGMGENWPVKLQEHSMPFGRMLLPEDIAEAAVYLLSDAATMLSGSVIAFSPGPW